MLEGEILENKKQTDYHIDPLPPTRTEALTPRWVRKRPRPVPTG